MALHGHSDARGYRQWQQVNRYVRSGEHAIHILTLVTRVIKEDDEEKLVTIGFAMPVFGLSQTDGDPLPRSEVDDGINTLPLRAVEKWGISVEAFNGRYGGSAGTFRPGLIGFGIRNLSTWRHELVHAADHRNGNLKELGQHWRSETVAELGGAVLLKILGHDAEADLGGCWEYISRCAERAKIHPLTACQRVLKRTCDAVSLILDAAERRMLSSTSLPSPLGKDSLLLSGI